MFYFSGKDTKQFETKLLIHVFLVNLNNFFSLLLFWKNLILIPYL